MSNSVRATVSMTEVQMNRQTDGWTDGQTVQLVHVVSWKWQLQLLLRQGVAPVHHGYSVFKACITAAVFMMPDVLSQIWWNVCIRCAVHVLKLVLCTFPEVLNSVGVDTSAGINKVQRMVDGSSYRSQSHSVHAPRSTPLLSRLMLKLI